MISYMDMQTFKAVDNSQFKSKKVEMPKFTRGDFRDFKDI